MRRARRIPPGWQTNLPRWRRNATRRPPGPARPSSPSDSAQEPDYFITIMRRDVRRPSTTSWYTYTPDAASRSVPKYLPSQ